MVASSQTVVEVISVLRKHLPNDKILKITKDLTFVEGNKSFKETIKMLHRGAVRLNKKK